MGEGEGEGDPNIRGVRIVSRLLYKNRKQVIKAFLGVARSKRKVEVPEAKNLFLNKKIFYRALYMPKKMRGSASKNMVLSVRVTLRLKRLVTEAAHGEGLYVSEWLRTLIVGELKKNRVLPVVLTPGE